jgi:hypothetical protein
MQQASGPSAMTVCRLCNVNASMDDVKTMTIVIERSVGVLLHAVQKVTGWKKGRGPRRLNVHDALNAPGQASGNLVLVDGTR